MISVIIPVYNMENYLQQCLDSIITDDVADYEIILVDDGSTDNSGRICDRYANKYSNINVVHQANGGLLQARRTGIKYAKGDYFLHVDSDDFVENSLLSRITTIINENQPDFIIYNFDHYDGLNFTRSIYKYPDKIGFIENKENLYNAVLSHSISNGIWGKVISRKIVDVHNDYENFKEVFVAEDLLQIMPYLTSATRIYMTDEVLYHYRNNPDSMSRKFNYRRYESVRRVEEVLYQEAYKWNVDDVDKKLAIHTLKELTWGTLRTLLFSNAELSNQKSYELFVKMANDELFRKTKKYISVSNLGLLRYLLLKVLYDKKYRMMTLLLNAMRFVVGRRYR